MNRIYLDYNATTPVDPAVVKTVTTVLKDIYGNPSSIHKEGRAARRILDDARDDVSDLLNCGPDEVVFTGCGSESNNLAIKGVARAYRDRGNHLITTKAEHPSVLNTFRYLESRGWRATYLDVDRDGKLDIDLLKSSISDDTVLVSLMMANNETGVICPIREAAALARERGVLFHTDAVQAVGKVGVDVEDLGVDLLSLAGHKFYGPKGVGALYVRKGTELEPVVHGGGQELGRRGGTENLADIAGLARAACMARESVPVEGERTRGLKSCLKAALDESVDDVTFIADKDNALPNTLSVSFKGLSGESLLMALDIEGVAVSAGSACSSGALKPSHVLTAMGLDDDVIRGTIRVSLGRWTTKEEIDTFLDILPPVVERLRKER